MARTARAFVSHVRDAVRQLKDCAREDGQREKIDRERQATRVLQSCSCGDWRAGPGAASWQEKALDVFYRVYETENSNGLHEVVQWIKEHEYWKKMNYSCDSFNR